MALDDDHVDQVLRVRQLLQPGAVGRDAAVNTMAANRFAGGLQLGFVLKKGMDNESTVLSQ